MSRLRKLLVVALVLAAVAVIVNVTDTNHSIKKLLRRKTHYPSMYARHFVKAKPLPPVGNEDAKVRLEVFVESANHCHQGTIELVRKIAEAVPKRIRVEFADTATKEGYEAATKAGINCDAGILVNGKNSITISEGRETFTVAFHGPLGMEMPPDYLRLAIDRELEKQYPEGLSKQEQADLDAVWKRVPEFAAEGFEGPGPGELSPDNALPHGMSPGTTPAKQSAEPAKPKDEGKPATSQEEETPGK